MTAKTIRIGCAAGFWGDSLGAAPQLVAKGEIDYLVFDYLAEITMSILARARAKNPEHGCALDFVSETMRRTLPAIAASGMRVVSNAGGVNPFACARALEALIAELGLSLTVAVVDGDDLMDKAEALRATGVREMYSGDPFPEEPLSVNAYLGALPIARALARGADIVITGRVVDSAVTLGPCIHAFGWTQDDYDRLAAGSLAGHIIECGAQATGGLFTDWRDVPGWENIGYPIAEIAADGACVITKPKGTGGLVNVATVAEQLVYEIGDPAAYVLPDVVCDFSDVHIEQRGHNRVRLSGAKGRAPTPTCKVSATWQDGYRLGATLSIIGREAEDKARATANAVLARVRAMLATMGAANFRAVDVEILGAEAIYGPHRRVRPSREVILKIAARHDERGPLNLLLRELTSAGTSMAPGTTGMGGNRPRVMPLIRLFSFLWTKDDIHPRITIGGESESVPFPTGQPLTDGKSEKPPAPEIADSIEVPLIRLAWARSGDKGDDANIGVIARRPDYLPYIRAALSSQAVAAWFSHLIEGPVERFEWPGIDGLNFVLHRALAGGGIASLRNDPQGKSYAQILLDFPVPVPKGLAASTA